MNKVLGEIPHYNLLREGVCPPYLVLINSFSKRYSMMGWRIGWMEASEEVITATLKVHTNLTHNLGRFHQQVAGPLLNDPDVEAEIGAHARQIEAQLSTLVGAIPAAETELTCERLQQQKVIS